MGFRMPTDSLRMARIHLGHNAPPPLPLSKVIPEPAQNRVNQSKFDFLSRYRVIQYLFGKILVTMNMI